MNKFWISIAALSLAPSSAIAQAPVTVTEVSATPEALATAKSVVDKLWPIGTYRRMMDGTMSKMMDGMIASMFDMRAADIAGMADPSGKVAKSAGNKSLGEMAEAEDPHFRERMSIMMNVMMGEMTPLMEKIEPSIRDSLATIYARRFSPAELGDMNIFFGTPSGKAYAEQSMMIFMDPEMIKNMQAFAPELIKAMPAIMQKVEKASAHLPPPPKPKSEPDNGK
jgi:hypothetical protein